MYGFYLHPGVSFQPVNAHCEDVGGDGKVTVESFTQPSMFDCTVFLFHIVLCDTLCGHIVYSVGLSLF